MGSMREDLMSNVTGGIGIVYGAQSATANGTAFDTQGYHSLMALVETGAWTSGTFVLSLEDSPDNSVWTAVVAGR